MQVKFQPINMYQRREMCPLQDLDSGQNDQLESVLFRKVKSESSTNAREMFPVGPRFLRLAPSRNTSNPATARNGPRSDSGFGRSWRFPVMSGVWSRPRWCADFFCSVRRADGWETPGGRRGWRVAASKRGALTHAVKY